MQAYASHLPCWRQARLGGLTAKGKRCFRNLGSGRYGAVSALLHNAAAKGQGYQRDHKRPTRQQRTQSHCNGQERENFTQDNEIKAWGQQAEELARQRCV